MEPNRNCCCCKGNAENQSGQQKCGQQNQQQQQQQQSQPNQGGVCKKELALMQILAEQMKPPPLQVSFKVGVPKKKDNCEPEEDFSVQQKNTRFKGTPPEDDKKCPLMEDNLKAIRERKNNNPK